MAEQLPDRLTTVSALSVPHTAAFLKVLVTSRQVRASWYIYFNQLPRALELYFMRGNTAGLSKFLQSTAKQMPDAADRDAQIMAEPGALTAALNWYRAIPFTYMRRVGAKITVPTMYVWGDGDTTLLNKAAHSCGRYVSGEYRFEALNGVSHWILDEQPQQSPNSYSNGSPRTHPESPYDVCKPPDGSAALAGSSARIHRTGVRALAAMPLGADGASRRGKSAESEPRAPAYAAAPATAVTPNTSATSLTES